MSAWALRWIGGFLAGLLVANGAFAAGLDRHDYSFELIDSSDIYLFQAGAYGVVRGGGWETNISVSASEFEVDYVPVSFDFRGSSVTRSERNYAIQANARKEYSESITLLLGAGYYDGHTNYRSIWLDEYYRQQFSDLPGVPGAESYIEASPEGFNASAGVRWMYLPASGYAQLMVSQLRDDISPGYEIDFDGLERGRIALDTTAISLSTENVLTERIRSLVTLRATRTTDRSWRYGVELAGNAALADKWIFRLQAGTTEEDPQFDAYYGSIAIEYAANDRLSVYLDGGHYEDTGEIENAFLFSSAAPGVTNRRIGLGLKWSGEKWSGRLYFAPSRARYDNTGSNVDFFGNLYKDRDWSIFQFALSRGY